MADLDETIEDVAASPKVVKGDSGEVQEHSLQDLIAAARYLANKSALAAGRRTVRFQKITAPDATL